MRLVTSPTCVVVPVQPPSLDVGGTAMEIRTSMGYVSLTRAPGRRVEARLHGRRADAEKLSRVLRLGGVGHDEAEKLASKLRHPSNAPPKTGRQIDAPSRWACKASDPRPSASK